MARKSFRDLTRAQQLARGPIDLPFLMLTLLLLAIGLLMLLSASSYAALYDPAAGYQVEDGVAQMGDALYYFKHQLIYAVLGVFVLWLVSRLDYQRWRAWQCPSCAWRWCSSFWSSPPWASTSTAPPAGSSCCWWWAPLTSPPRSPSWGSCWSLPPVCLSGKTSPHGSVGRIRSGRISCAASSIGATWENCSPMWAS